MSTTNSSAHAASIQLTNKGMTEVEGLLVNGLSQGRLKHNINNMLRDTAEDLSERGIARFSNMCKPAPKKPKALCAPLVLQMRPALFTFARHVLFIQRILANGDTRKRISAFGQAFPLHDAIGQGIRRCRRRQSGHHITLFGIGHE